MSRSVTARETCDSPVCTATVLASTEMASVVGPTSSFTISETVAPASSWISLRTNFRKPAVSTVRLYTPGCSAAKTKMPSVLDVACTLTCVFTLTAWIAALGTTAPVWSWTVPSRRLVWVCATAIAASAKTATTTTSNFRIDIDIPSSFIHTPSRCGDQRGSYEVDTTPLLPVVQDQDEKKNPTEIGR